jgi:hypothetical protein
MVKARIRYNDGKASTYLVVRPSNTDRTPLGQDGIARPLRRARIRCEGSCGVLRQAWRPLLLAAIMTCGCSESRWGLHSCTSEKEALGFAVRKLRCGHAVQEISERADSELFKRADTAAIESDIDKSANASASGLGIAWPGG